MTMRDLLYTYGDPAAVLAADFMVRNSPGIIKRVEQAIIEDGASQEQIERAVRSALNFIYRDEPTPKALINRLSSHLKRYVTSSARNTTIATAERYGKRWARVPSGLETCSYCLMLCSRGFVYKSEKAAHSGFHDNCDCMVIASDTDNPFERSVLEGYDPEHLYEQWQAVENGDLDIKDVVWRPDQGLPEHSKILGIKGLPIEMEEAAKGTNPKYALNTGYKYNCQRCVPIYELRRRGYNVSAAPKPKVGNTIKRAIDCFENITLSRWTRKPGWP
jgi:hypothetical protein